MAYAYLHLDLDERRRIYRLHAKKLSVAAIARELGRHRSTIFRELRRNAWVDPEHKSLHGGSIPSEASNGFPHEIRGLGRGVVAPTVSQRPGAA